MTTGLVTPAARAHRRAPALTFTTTTPPHPGGSAATPQTSSGRPEQHQVPDRPAGHLMYPRESGVDPSCRSVRESAVAEVYDAVLEPALIEEFEVAAHA